MFTLKKPLLLIFIVTLLTACSTAIQPMKSDAAIVNYRSQVYKDLVSLPPPTSPITIVVYKIKDQTGQYKDSENLVQYSTAVTQGATAMVVKALQDVGHGSWFTILEREGLSNLPNERKIIRQTRKQYAANNKPTQVLPPLMYAPILLEGSVVSYESNLLTGGVGVRYLGLGGDTQFRRDTATVYMRAVSVKNGQIIASINTSKEKGLELGLGSVKGQVVINEISLAPNFYSDAQRAAQAPLGELTLNVNIANTSYLHVRGN